jgi:hypothetical protein
MFGFNHHTAREDKIAGQLAHLLLETGDRGQREILHACGADIDISLGGLERDRLRPDPVFAGLHRREVVLARFIGEDVYLKPGMFGVPLLINSRITSSWPPSEALDRSGPRCPPVVTCIFT